MQWLLKFRVCVIVCLAVLLILAAIAFSVVRGVLPYATGYKTEIETGLSRQIGLPVHIDRIDADMHWFSPRLKLLQVSVYNTDNKIPLFHFDEILFELDSVRSLLRAELTVGEISLVGVDLSVEKHSDTHWVIQGMDIDSSASQGQGMMEQLLYTLQHADYSLLESNIYYRDYTKRKLSLDLLDVNINVENDMGEHRLALSMKLPPAYGEYLKVVAELNGALNKPVSGSLYVDGKGINVSQWNKKFNWLPDYRLSGVLDASLWGELKNGELYDLTSQFTADTVSLARNDNSRPKQNWHVDRASGLFRLTQLHKHWILNVSDFFMEHNGRAEWPQATNLIAGFDNHSLSLSADFLRLQDVLKIARIVAVDPARLKAVEDLAVRADVYNLKLSVDRENIKALEVQGEFVDLGFHLSDVPLVVNGVDATIHYRHHEMEVDLLSRDVGVYLSDLFRESLQADSLEGRVTVQLSPDFSEDRGWSLQAPSLHMQNSHIDTYTRLAMVMPPKPVALSDRVANLSDIIANPVSDNASSVKAEAKAPGGQASVELHRGAATEVAGAEAVDSETADSEAVDAEAADSEAFASEKNTSETVSVSTEAAMPAEPQTQSAPAAEKEPQLFVDAQTNFYDAYGQYATHYLPVGIMSEGLVSWLDESIHDGYVEQGRFILRGEVSDFPFNDGTGVMEVLFRPVNASLRFLPEWPEITDMSATIKFYNRSMSIYNAVGKSEKGYISSASVEIDNLEKAELEVQASITADAADVQAYVWHSPLDKTLGNTLRLFQ
ncbi:MAG TPA: hypothetical protein ENJ64_03660, partial [Thiotrichales bacterium]|nr:hypothetical protein [Thiotrichales bacterium]